MRAEVSGDGGVLRVEGEAGGDSGVAVCRGEAGDAVLYSRPAMYGGGDENV